MGRTYIAIDLKSFYASVECVDRGLDPLTARLVVADPTRTSKTICLAVSPALKAYGIPGRARLFEVEQKVKMINASNPSLHLDFIVAPPQMYHYMTVSSRVYEVYLKYVSAEDVHVYSIDEVFIDVTSYLKTYGCTAHELAMRMIRDVLSTTGITATAGIGTNLYLAKVAMDIVAKHCEPDKDGVRIASLDEMSYRQILWSHKPMTDFWRFGRGITARLAAVGIETMGQLARRSLDPAWEEFFYKTFGVNAELIIDHAWGWEPCTMEQIKSYKPSVHSLSSGQVLSSPYDFTKARLIVREMTDSLVLDLVEKGLVTDQIGLNVGYDTQSLAEDISFKGEVVRDYYGRDVPKPAHGTSNLPSPTSSTDTIMEAMMDLFDRIVDKKLLVRRLNVVANKIVDERDIVGRQLDLFSTTEEDPREKKRQKAIIEIRKRFGKNAILKGMNFEEGATAIERNQQIGGHKA